VIRIIERCLQSHIRVTVSTWVNGGKFAFKFPAGHRVGVHRTSNRLKVCELLLRQGKIDINRVERRQRHHLLTGMIICPTLPVGYQADHRRRANFLLSNHRPHVVDRAFFLFEFGFGASSSAFEITLRAARSRVRPNLAGHSKSVRPFVIALLPMRHRA